MMLLDTSGILAALFPDQDRHRECAEVLLNAQAPLILSPFVLAEVDYLVSRRAGVEIALRILQDVARHAYSLAPFRASDIERAHDIISKYRDLEIGLADASIVVLSERHATHDLLTLDERHFRVLTGADRKPFRLLPTDASI